MKTKPILFNERMVRAILEGRKKQTRRLIKPRYSGDACNFQVLENTETGARRVELIDEYENGLDRYVKSAYKEGDILYVREAWQYVYETEYDRECGKENNYCRNIRTLIANWDDVPKTLINEKSQNESCDGMAPRPQYAVFRASDIRYTDPENKLLWKPSIHMPKEAARIWLKVTGVGIEQLQDITEEDAQAEGFYKGWSLTEQSSRAMTAKQAFMWLWDTTVDPNDDYSKWLFNPWVWVYSFERCEKP